MEKTLVTSADLQVKYEHLYKYLMNFLWEFSVVQSIARLEMAIFKRFPEKDEMRNCLAALKKDIVYTYNELDADDDPEFKEAMEDLENAIDEYDEESTGCELPAVEEVISDPRDVNASDDMTLPNGKRKFKFGEIRKITKEERELMEEAAHTLNNPFENKNEEGEEE